MVQRRKLQLILCWHMHQPDYRHALTQRFEMPWTYLHALKDYTDMAAHLERHPDMSAVVNLVPSLVDQLDDYARQYAAGVWHDPLLQWLQSAHLDDLSGTDRQRLIDACLRCHAPKMIDPFPPYRLLRDWVQRMKQDEVEPGLYVSGQFLADLLVWYHLAWLGESVRRSEPLVARLMTQGKGFTLEDRHELNALIGTLLTQILPRYRALQATGRVELSTTPAYHPIMPLLLDFNAAREAVPHLALPMSPAYPGGAARAVAQVREAQASYQTHFEQSARGVWPGEGALSTESLDILADQGFRWTASSETVLANSLRLSWGQTVPEKSAWLYQPYLHTSKHGSILCYFRDDRLSDRIGFDYAQWESGAAAQDFVAQLEAIYHAGPATHDQVVTVILDGENAWEYYPYNGFYFLDHLYQLLTEHAFIRTTTFAAHSAKVTRAAPLNQMVAGSWVYGSLTTWMGDAYKNAAWDLLVKAKECYDHRVATLSATQQVLATRQLSVCEGSDWFWWFGDYNNADSVRTFDELYRLNLTNLYLLMGVEPPTLLSHPLSQGARGHEAGGAMRRTSY
ncbi:MAG: glycoside hydrolase [Ferrovum sp.]|nr:glycoside hydrolase [Ferrovum sp.]NDU87039.1 glycoside hydrolase [Ferrovum sp.]